ncbi:MAG: HAD family phosphatase [Chloroflexi bacterium]|nr:HAD family phosphatase [Chloroflexota bacterium]
MRDLALKAIIWDMDGVLADSGDAHYLAWQMLLRETGQQITRQQFDDTFGMANSLLVRHWFGDTLSPETSRALALRKEEIFRQLVAEHVRILPGVEQWLERFRRRGYRQAVASSGEMANVVAVIHALGLGNYFDALLSGAFLPHSKPDPALFLQTAAALGATPGECLVLEDGLPGIEAARRAGMPCIALTTTHPAEKLASADLILDSLANLDEETLECLLEHRCQARPRAMPST